MVVNPATITVKGDTLYIASSDAHIPLNALPDAAYFSSNASYPFRKVSNAVFLAFNISLLNPGIHPAKASVLAYRNDSSCSPSLNIVFNLFLNGSASLSAFNFALASLASFSSFFLFSSAAFAIFSSELGSSLSFFF